MRKIKDFLINVLVAIVMGVYILYDNLLGFIVDVIVAFRYFLLYTHEDFVDLITVMFLEDR